MNMNGDDRDEFEEFKARSHSCGCLKISPEQLASLGTNVENIPASSLLSPTYKPRGKSVSPRPSRRQRPRSRSGSRSGSPARLEYRRRSRSNHELKVRGQQSYMRSYMQESYFESESGEETRIYRLVLHV